MRTCRMTGKGLCWNYKGCRKTSTYGRCLRATGRSYQRCGKKVAGATVSIFQDTKQKILL